VAASGYAIFEYHSGNEWKDHTTRRADALVIDEVEE
jgi:hypothetical protein